MNSINNIIKYLGGSSDQASPDSKTGNGDEEFVDAVESPTTTMLAPPNVKQERRLSFGRKRRGSSVNGSSSGLTGDGHSESSIVMLECVDTEPVYGDSRTKLPVVMVQRNQISVWSILKQCIGKELSKITMPCVFNEPLTFLQRLSEYMEYSPLLHKASETEDPVKRMELVAAFAVSGLASNWERLGKPFNPLLGETYELDRRHDLGFRVISEQVSHHPPVSAFHVDSDSYKFSGSVYPKLKFWGRSVEITPKGVLTLVLLKHGETYTWSNVNVSVHNIVMGKLWIEQHGKMEIINHQNGLQCVLDFKPTSSWFGRESNHIEGYIYDKGHTRLRALYGIWTDFLASVSVESFDSLFASWGRDREAGGQHGGIHKSRPSARNNEKMPQAPPFVRTASVPPGDDAVNEEEPVPFPLHKASVQSGESITTVIPVLPNSDLLWRVHPRPEDSEQFYHFTLFAIMLNELDPVRHTELPPTDSRLRPDMRKMEDGDLDVAVEEKHRLEEKQREARTRRKKTKNDWTPLWFKSGRHPLTKDDTWLFTDRYWNRDWSRCPNIF